jgi:hypothetical protein
MLARIGVRKTPPVLMTALLVITQVWGCRTPVVTPEGAPIVPEACAVHAPQSDAIFLIGDAGAPKLSRDDTGELVDPLLSNLRQDVREYTKRLGKDHVAVIFLGDNVYWDGVPPEGHKGRRRAERILEAQIAASDPARAVFVMGNHDWHVEGPEGWDRVLYQRDFLEKFAPRVMMRPVAGCAGPDHVDVGEHLRVVFFDPIGLEHLFDHPEEHKQRCPDRTLHEAFLDLAAEFDHPEGRHVMMALHHPLITAGPHGGHFTWRQHIFPLTDFWPWAWLPLPVIGSIYPISRQLGVTSTDLSNEVYGRVITTIYRATRPRVPAIFAAGHEHSLQVHRDIVGAYYLVSGSGSKVNRVERTETSMFSEASKGYMRLDLHSDGALGVDVLAMRSGKNVEPIFSHCLATGPPLPERDRRELRPE